MTVVPLEDANQEPDQDTVEALEEALELARSGQMRSVSIAASLTGHRTFTTYATRDLQEAIGLVSFMHFTLCARQRETPDPYGDK